MIDTSEILTQADQYAFSLFDINLIDFDNIDFDNDDVISLPLITAKVPIITDNLDDDMCLFINDTILYGEMWFAYNPIDHAVEMLIAEHGAIQSATDISSIIFLMEQCQHPEYERYKLSYDKFIDDIKEKLKEQIKAIMTEVKGKFVADKFIKDTYFQVRKFDGKNIFYGINKWWNGLCEGEVNFVDVVNGEGTVFIARCN